MLSTRSPGLDPSRAVRWARRHRLIAGGLMLTLLATASGILAPWLAPYPPEQINPLNRLQAPSAVHPFGTDELGRDVLSRVLFGARLSLSVGALVVILSTSLGTICGLLAGYFRYLDSPIMRVMDGLMALPDLLLAIALMAALGPNMGNVVIALGIVYTPRVARVVRSAVLIVREREYVQAAQALGASSTRVILRHVLPNAASPLIVQASFTFAFSVLGEASLSFLGVGVPPGVPSWGNILAGGRQYMTVAPWIAWFPGLAIVLTVLGLNLLGDGLRDLLDPRLRRLG
ncbi:ABC transporter permease [Geochorda subterranea]|uniref:ABC transporter permease n=1 Tax=Geochorda subterranea TaxID=3109564 RepID=A0ABZ1BU39_9FIRM|nr:ABC transporter permease [Limnochorda sp. LNt]WRP15995.1 ABC transporter permease [Limnochorda sp. LNt]